MAVRKKDPTANEREGYLGGSDAAAIMGVSPWASPMRVFAQKRGHKLSDDDEVDEAREERFLWGHLLETVIAKEAGKRLSLRITAGREVLYRNKEFPFIAGHLDFFAPAAPAIIECKNVGSFNLREWGDDSAAVDCAKMVPGYYLAQCDHYMLVTGYPLTYLCALVGGCRLRIYRLERNADREALLLRSLLRFWERVEKDDPPMTSDPADRIIARQCGYLNDGPEQGAIQLTANEEHHVREFASAKRAYKAAVEAHEPTVDDLKSRVKIFGCDPVDPDKKQANRVRLLGQQEALLGSISVTQRAYFSSRLLKAKDPAAYESGLVPRATTTLRLAKADGTEEGDDE